MSVSWWTAEWRVDAEGREEAERPVRIPSQGCWCKKTVIWTREMVLVRKGANLQQRAVFWR